jgi:hypothetical protein
LKARGRCGCATIRVENGKFFEIFVNGDITVVSCCKKRLGFGGAAAAGLRHWPRRVWLREKGQKRQDQSDVVHLLFSMRSAKSRPSKRPGAQTERRAGEASAWR